MANRTFKKNNSHNSYGEKRCDLCNSLGHIMRNCSLYVDKNSYDIYLSAKHNHLSYVNSENIKSATKASFILNEFFKIDTSSHGDLLIAIEELAYNNYNKWMKYLSKLDCIEELNALKGKTNRDINKFISNDGLTIIAKFIVSNS
jgi:hypothetical protein